MPQAVLGGGLAATTNERTAAKAIDREHLLAKGEALLLWSPPPEGDSPARGEYPRRRCPVDFPALASDGLRHADGPY